MRLWHRPFDWYHRREMQADYRDGFFPEDAETGRKKVPEIRQCDL